MVQNTRIIANNDVVKGKKRQPPKSPTAGGNGNMQPFGKCRYNEQNYS